MEATITQEQDMETKTIKCGNCKGYHGSRDEVRQCCMKGVEGVTLRAVQSTYEPASTQPTERQLSYIRALMAERMPEGGRGDSWASILGNDMEQMIAGLTKKAASDMIGSLLKDPEAKKPRGGQRAAERREAKSDLVDVPEGYYAVSSLSGANDLDFFKVDRPTEGRWAGYVFVKQVVGGKPEFRVARDRVQQVIDTIAEVGWQEAAALYGQEIGRCGVCNRTLTDEVSRQYGIGPVCREAL